MTTGNREKVKKRILKPVSDHTIVDLDLLYEKVYKRRPVKNYFHDKLAANLAGAGFGGFIAYNDQYEPVACLCTIGTFITGETTKILAAQLTDGMTDPLHQNEGWFTELADAVTKKAQQNGVALLYGFPNQNASPLLKKNGWEETQQLDRFEIPVARTPRWILNRLSGKSPIHFDRQTGCSNSVIKDGFAGLERSEEFLRYKTYTGTGSIIRGNAKAWIKVDHDIAIGDMDCDESSFPSLLAAIERIAVARGASRIHFQCSGGTSLHKWFAAKFKAIPSFPVLEKWTDPSARMQDIKFTYADIDIF